MAFDVTLYTFSKRKNSTVKPTGGTVFSGLMREPCGVIRPSVSFEFAAGVNPSAYNYAYIPTFGRYYFINEWTSVGRLWVCSMEVDALASWQEEIGSQRLYVLRSSARSDPSIIDTYYPAKTGPDVEYEYESFDNWSYSFSGGTYVVGILSPDVNGIGACVYYAMTSSQFRQFNNYLLSTIEWVSPGNGLWAEISEELAKVLFNPFQYIASCVWIPISITGKAVDSIPYGWNWNINRTASRLSGSLLYSSEMTMTVPHHPDYAQFGSFIHSAPYSQYVLTVPPFGTYPLDPNIASQTEDVTISVDVDAMTGVGRLQVRGAGYTFVDTSTQVGVHVQLAQAGVDIEKGAQSVAQVTAGAAGIAGGDYAGGAKTLAGAIVSALSFVTQPNISSMGSTGSNATLGPAKMEGIFYHPSSPSVTLFGKPLCERVLLSSIPGYIQVLEPHVSIACTDGERGMIESFLESGFHYEGGD